VPPAEREFLCDQRSHRSIVIDKLDNDATAASQKRNERRMARAKQFLPSPSNEIAIDTDIEMTVNENLSSSKESSNYEAPQQLRRNTNREKGHIVLAF